jgi:uncharacterized membrane protein
MKLVLLYVMTGLYVAAGIYHFVNPRFYQKIMPTYLPWHIPLVYISGVCEMVFALLLIPESTRPMAAWLIIILLIAVFPANIQMAVSFWQKQRPTLWIALARLPLQLVLIWWAWIYTKK